MAVMCGVFLVALLGTTTLWAEPYRVQPGDALRVVIGGLPNGDWISEIDMDGSVRFPYLGEIVAAGRTVAELTEEVELAAAGREIAFYGLAGERTEVLLGDAEIFLTVESYREVTVGGDVSEPGAVPYVPGMTARAAIAAAGGTGQLDRGDATDVSRIMTEYETTAVEEAQMLAEIWRLGALLDAEQDPPPAETVESIEARLGAAFLEQTQDLIDTTLASHRRSETQLSEQIELYDERIGYLGETLQSYEAAAEAEREELAQIQLLFDRGVASLDRLSDMRRSALSSGTRLLETEAALAEARLERRALEQERAAMRGEADEELLAEKAEVDGQLAETRARLEGLRGEAATLGISAAVLGAERATVAVTVHRRVGGEPTRTTIELDELLGPGDVLDVALKDPAP